LNLVAWEVARRPCSCRRRRHSMPWLRAPCDAFVCCAWMEDQGCSRKLRDKRSWQAAGGDPATARGAGWAPPWLRRVHSWRCPAHLFQVPKARTRKSGCIRMQYLDCDVIASGWHLFVLFRRKYQTSAVLRNCSPKRSSAPFDAFGHLCLRRTSCGSPLAGCTIPTLKCGSYPVEESQSPSFADTHALLPLLPPLIGR
jgi:hypothetical protein